MLEQSDIIAVMSDSHAKAVIELGADPERVRVLAGGGNGIADPFSGDINVYRQTRDQLEKAVRDLADDVIKNEE